MNATSVLGAENSQLISRRKFLVSTATLLVAAEAPHALASDPSPPKPTPKRIVVGAHPWVYAAPLPNYDITPVLPAIFEDMSYAGLDGIELMHNALRPKDAVERISELFGKHRLAVIGMSFSGTMWDRSQQQAVMDDAELIIPRLAKLGGRTMGTSVESPGRRKTDAELDAQAELLRKLADLCRRHGVVLNLHNHTYEVNDNMYDLKGTLTRIPDAKLGPDLNWLVRGGVDPVWFIREYGRQIVFLHLRDQKKDGRWSEALGEGNMDYAAISRALDEIKFQGDAIIELAHERDFTPTRPLRESLQMSREFVRKTLGY
jgi:sugar phosphate isomerase/epimerase